MKSRSAALAAHQAQATTTLAWCWRVTRADGEVYTFTSCDVPLTIDGRVYEAATGFTPSAIDQKADLSVPNLDVVGVLDSSSITEQDLLAGLWDGAEVQIFEVNYRDLNMGRMILRTGTLGNVSAGRVSFNAELRGLAQGLQQPVGRVYAAACDANLGDARCGVDLEALAGDVLITAVTSNRGFIAAGAMQPQDYWGGGTAEWLTGQNAGLKMEISNYIDGQFQLALPMPYALAVGDTVRLRPGCRKRFTQDCVGKYNNAINFRGFPHVPGNDKVLGNAGLPTT